jgi:hypothetical protein
VFYMYHEYKKVYILPLLYGSIFYACCYNTSCQLTTLLNLRCLIFGLTPSGRLRTWALRGDDETHGAEQNWDVACLLKNTSVTVGILFIADHVTYI